MGESRNDAQVILSVPRCLVKSTKDALQSHQRLDRSAKIKPFCGNEAVMYLALCQDTNSSEGNYLVPTTFRARPEDDEVEKVMLKAALLDMISVSKQTHSIGIYLRNVSSPGSYLPAHESSQPTSILGQIVKKWLLALPPCVLPFSIFDLVSVSTWPYTVYHPLLLLPQNTFSNHPWPHLFSTTLRSHLPALYKLLSTRLKITHIALNAPIPTLIPGTPNILRKPENLIPLYGSFGPSLSPTHIPSTRDFEAAFWCTVRQNGIFQTWAPRHTMFSRGNISEKTRLLNLKTLTAEGLGGNLPSATSAVDLYAGIGYFAFCYAKLRVGKILCWELSGWSVEGLRRGSIGNGWGVEVFKPEEAMDHNENIIDNIRREEKKQIFVFQEDNQNAAYRISALRSSILPVRHVNCGFLPTSQGSWETAVRALDPKLGGWIHAHENIEKASFGKRKEEIVKEFRELARKRWSWRGIGAMRSSSEQSEEGNVIIHVDEMQSLVNATETKTATAMETETETKTATKMETTEGGAAATSEKDCDDEKVMMTMTVECVHFEQVKSYAPGVVHCVLDIAILPTPTPIV